MRAKFLGAARTVTGSATLLQKESLNWLVDCGMHQGNRSSEQRNWTLAPYRARDLAFLLLTHAHLDHSGLIPRLAKEGFGGRVLCTRATRDLCEVMLRDSGHIQEMEAEWRNRKGRRSGRGVVEPLYTVQDAEESLRLFDPVRYDEVVSPAPGVKVRFRDAGHILGSAIIEIWIEEGGAGKKLVLSGDLGSPGQPLIRDPARVDEADHLWLESTYGDRVHRSREDTVQELFQIIDRAIRDQAKVVIPAFAVERTQDVIYTLGGLIRKGLLPAVPIYIDSPLAISATEIFKKNADCFDEETRAILLSGNNPLDLPQLVFARTSEESKAINEDRRSGIIISASGMCDAGRILHHLKHHLWQSSSHVVIIGYQANGTIGRRIVDGEKTVRLFGEDVTVKAHIHTLGGFSGHADRNGLLDWLSHFKNPHLEVIVNHGEEKASLALAGLIQQRFGFRTFVPHWKEKRSLVGMEEAAIQERALPDEESQVLEPAEQLSHMFKQLDRKYKKLRQKLKRGVSVGKFRDPLWMKQVEDVSWDLRELARELDELRNADHGTKRSAVPDL